MRKIEPFEDDRAVEKLELVELIKAAFMDRQLPDSNDIVYNPLTADAGIEQVYSGKLWHNLDYKFISENRNGIYFFSNNAFKYFIPAFMIAAIENYEEMDEVPDIVVSIFTLPEEADSDSARIWFFGRMSGFNDNQRNAIIKYLKYMERYYKTDDLMYDPKIAYIRYWSKM